MKRTTRELINARNKHKVTMNGYRQEALYIANVQKIETHEMGKCFQTAMEGRFIDALGTGSKRNIIASGWTVGEYNKALDGYEITSHYWNIDDKTYKHFDLSKGERDSEYVLDMGLSIWAQDKANHARIRSDVAKSLLYKDGKWRTYEEIDGERIIENIQELKVENLFRLK
jgi:hypothetical protein